MPPKTKKRITRHAAKEANLTIEEPDRWDFDKKRQMARSEKVSRKRKRTEDDSIPLGEFDKSSASKVSRMSLDVPKKRVRITRTLAKEKHIEVQNAPRWDFDEKRKEMRRKKQEEEEKQLMESNTVDEADSSKLKSKSPKKELKPKPKKRKTTRSSISQEDIELVEPARFEFDRKRKIQREKRKAEQRMKELKQKEEEEKEKEKEKEKKEKEIKEKKQKVVGLSGIEESKEEDIDLPQPPIGNYMSLITNVIPIPTSVLPLAGIAKGSSSSKSSSSVKPKAALKSNIRNTKETKITKPSYQEKEFNKKQEKEQEQQQQKKQQQQKPISVKRQKHVQQTETEPKVVNNEQEEVEKKYDEEKEVLNEDNDVEMEIDDDEQELEQEQEPKLNKPASIPKELDMFEVDMDIDEVQSISAVGVLRFPKPKVAPPHCALYMDFNSHVSDSLYEDYGGTLMLDVLNHWSSLDEQTTAEVSIAKFEEIQGGLINYQMRTILFDWMVRVSDDLCLRTHVLLGAFQYVDRFFCSRPVTPQSLACIGSAALMLANKMDRGGSMSSSVLKVCGQELNLTELCQIERQMFHDNDYSLNVVTTQHFLKKFFLISQSSTNEAMYAYYLCDLMHLNPGTIGITRASVAAAALAYARLVLRRKFEWNEYLRYVTQMSFEELSPMIILIHNWLGEVSANQKARSTVKHVIERYQQPHLGNAAAITALNQEIFESEIQSEVTKEQRQLKSL